MYHFTSKTPTMTLTEQVAAFKKRHSQASAPAPKPPKQPTRKTAARYPLSATALTQILRDAGWEMIRQNHDEALLGGAIAPVVAELRTRGAEIIASLHLPSAALGLLGVGRLNSSFCNPVTSRIVLDFQHVDVVALQTETEADHAAIAILLHEYGHLLSAQTLVTLAAIGANIPDAEGYEDEIAAWQFASGLNDQLGSPVPVEDFNAVKNWSLRAHGLAV